MMGLGEKMELRQLECLIACVETKSFSKAATVLYTSQSNVSKTIASLEKELGKKLFERGQHGIELTVKGNQVYSYALSIMECSAKIVDCMDEEETEELHISFQSGSWFANVFCEYYLQTQGQGARYRLISASVEEILRRLILSQDQLGFACIEEKKLQELSEMFHSNHISHIVLKKTKPVLYCGAEADKISRSELRLIQGIDDDYSGISLWKNEKRETNQRLNIKVATNSDSVMQIMLQKTNLCNISPEYLCSKEDSPKYNMVLPEEDKKTVLFVCFFRNDHEIGALPKRFLSFVKKYAEN